MSERNQEWPSHIHREYAEQDGLTPDDLRFEQWPVSNVALRHIAPDEYFPEDIALVYSCQIPSETPHCNQYDDNNNPIPNPVGMALQSVHFELQNATTGEILDEDPRDHDNGNVIGFLGGRCALWNYLSPGTSIQVRLVAYPLFYYINRDGAAMLAYAIGNNQHFRGATIESDIYTLSMNENGGILLDGQPRPQAAEEAPVLPDDYQEGMTFGQYIKMRREANNLSQFDLGQQTNQPWKSLDGQETYDPQKWIEWIEADNAQLKIEHEGAIHVNSNQITGLAIALGVYYQHLENLCAAIVK